MTQAQHIREGKVVVADTLAGTFLRYRATPRHGSAGNFGS